MKAPKNTRLAFKGKIISGFMYAHKSATSLLQKKHSHSLNKSLQLLNDFEHWNVIKFNLRDDTNLSFLEYESFEKHEFPCLIQSCQVDLKAHTIKVRKHSTFNPPVLHRKELLIRPDHPEANKFKKLTLQLETLGAFKNIVKLGTKNRWADELNRLNIVIKDHIATQIDRPTNVN